MTLRLCRFTPWLQGLGAPPEQHFGVLQTKALIDKLQKLVSSEGRFKNLREALKK